ncbi:MAG: hypothetical protein PUG67_04885 [Peptoniphilaceae bacterium]|nr:hypothetical protein [Peptoniphilaceae bacterium]MDY6019419.1 hypothetical protein [Anaerococcus sp.]
MKILKKLFIVMASLFLLASCKDSQNSVEQNIPSEDMDLVEKIKENENPDGVFTYQTSKAANNELVNKVIIAHNNKDKISIDETIEEGQDDIVYIFYEDSRLFINKTKENYYEGPYNRSIFDKILGNTKREEVSPSIIEEYLSNNPGYGVEKEDGYTLIKLDDGQYRKYDSSYKLVESFESSERMNTKTELIDEDYDFDKFYKGLLDLRDKYKKEEDMSQVTGKG